MDHSIKPILNRAFKFKVAGTLWIECSEERFFGPGRMELLEGIADTGSISKAAHKMGMSYKKAWEMVKALNEQTASPVVIPQIGGEKGGGSILTAEAWKLIEYHRALRKRFTHFLEKESARLKK